MESIYTVQQLAKLLKLHPETVRNFARNGTLKGFKTSESSRAHWRFHAKDVPVKPTNKK